MKEVINGDKIGGSFADQRRTERYEVFNTLAQIKCGFKEESLVSDLSGVVLNLSSSGCCVIVRAESIPEAFSFCRVTIGNHILVLSQVRWIHEVGENLYKLGLMYQV